MPLVWQVAVARSTNLVFVGEYAASNVYLSVPTVELQGWKLIGCKSVSSRTCTVKLQ